MTKLFGLYCIKDVESIMNLLACSNEIDKLTAITPVSYFYIPKRTSKVVRHTEEGIYPRYIIKELPFVC